MQPNFFKDKGVIILVVVVIVAIAIAIYITSNRTQEEIDVSTPDATSEVVPTPNTASVPTSSPISPLSPVLNSSVTSVDSVALQQMSEKGIQLYETGNYQASIEMFSAILTQNPGDIVAYNYRGSAYNALGDYEKALDDYNKAIELDIRFPHAYYNRGRLYSSLKKYEEALADLQKSFEFSPIEFGYRANGNIGLIYHQMGEYDKALEAFDASISYNKDERADVYYYRGETHTVLENYEAAIADYEAAVARFSRYGLAFQSLGYAYYKTEQFDKALDNLNQALEIFPDNPTAHFYLALVHLATDEFDTAEAEASQAVDTISTLSEEEQKLILTRVLADLETFAQEHPDKAKEVESIIKLVPRP